MNKSKTIGSKNRWTKAGETWKLAKTFSKLALTNYGYSSVFLLGRKGYEAAGIVDLVGIKKRKDQIEIVLFQVKGNQKVTSKEIKRLKRAAEKAKIKYGIIEYKKGELPAPKIFD